MKSYNYLPSISFSHYLIIGNGRVSQHIQYYYTQLGLPFEVWQRSKHDEEQLKIKVQQASHILILISDQQLEDFLQKHQVNFQNKICVHASGRISTRLAHSAHPLMSFPSCEPYSDIAIYKSIPFVLEMQNDGQCNNDEVECERKNAQETFSSIMPGVPNKAYIIPASMKPLYHALCVLCGNFTVLLWQKVISRFADQDFQLPADVLWPYLRQISQNIQNNPKSALSGPLARGDYSIIQDHLHALKNDPYQKVYQAFCDAFLERPEV